MFLDEIGELPTGLQAKLLRVIETREVYRVGGLQPIPLTVRFISATHRDLAVEVTTGRFRNDLYFRINGITLELAPLRDRRPTITRLAHQFVDEIAARVGRPPPRLTVEALAKMSMYRWPGNVRELRAVVERAVLLCDDDEIPASAVLVDAASGPPADFVTVAYRRRGNVSAIARELATSRSHVHRMARRFGVELSRLRGA